LEIGNWKLEIEKVCYNIFMKKYLLIIAIILIMPNIASAADLRGRFVINPVDGQAWYVRPDNKKVIIGAPGLAYVKLKTMAETVADKDIQLIASSASSTQAIKYKGKILAKQSDGAMWYVYPKDNKLVDFSSPLALNLFIARNADKPNYHTFARLHKPGMDESIDQYSYYKSQTISLPGNKKFKVDMVVVDLATPNLKIYTLAANKTECPKNCPAKNVADFTASVKGFAAINGTYFDTAANKKNFSFFPLYDTRTGYLLNKKDLRTWTNGPLMAFDTQNRMYYYKDARKFLPDLTTYGNKTFVNQNGRTGELRAALGSFPRLVEEGNDYLIDWAMDKKQRDAKAARNALAIKDNKAYLMVVQNSTVTELTAVLMSMGMEYALNLDGGYSTALFYNHEYVLGPGRDVVNALVFSLQ